MMLPSLISVSVAPGSYFFCARAGVVASTPAARMARAASLLRRPGIVLSPVFCSLVLPRVSQGHSWLASTAIFRNVKPATIGGGGNECPPRHVLIGSRSGLIDIVPFLAARPERNSTGTLICSRGYRTIKEPGNAE